MITTTSEQTIEAGQYLAGSQTISAVPTKVKSATPTFTQQTVYPTSGKFLSEIAVYAIPIQYKYTSSSTATAEDIASGKIVFNASGQVICTATIVDIGIGVVHHISCVANTANVANFNAISIPNSGAQHTLPQCLAGFTQFLTAIYGASSSAPLTFRFTISAPVYVQMDIHGKYITSEHTSSTEVNYDV